MMYGHLRYVPFAVACSYEKSPLPESMRERLRKCKTNLSVACRRAQFEAGNNWLRNASLSIRRPRVSKLRSQSRASGSDVSTRGTHLKILPMKHEIRSRGMSILHHRPSRVSEMPSAEIRLGDLIGQSGLARAWGACEKQRLINLVDLAGLRCRVHISVECRALRPWKAWLARQADCLVEGREWRTPSRVLSSP
ncbi:hypothetical protein K458DRAFT_53598 [Lentithecium fluviatile CBS 122367]|uniref:Uncharacterized protein n=1 Tax=Lentithecium fluviatile CBS 122367 TaxID=1168545 RepID=A0A6G1IX42_9PLEO|nr:hypothetical protein K458DRAFT_53598 [Lentithecium fluviatile CBS 122367]